MKHSNLVLRVYLSSRYWRMVSDEIAMNTHFMILRGMFVIFCCLLCKPLILGDIEGISALVSSMDPTTKENLLRRCSAGPSDLILFAVGHHASVNKTLDRLRVYVAHELGLIDHVSW